MRTLRILLQASGALTGWTVLTGMVSGACSAAMLALINTTLQESRASLGTLGAIFAGLATVKLASNALSQLLMSRFSQRAVAGLRRQLARRILVVPLRQIEEVGSPRILACLIDDVQTLSNALVAVPTIVVSGTILLGGSAYLAWLAPKAFGLMVGFVALGLLLYRLLLLRGYRYVRLARAKQDQLFDHLRSLTEGVKELKLHRARRESFLHAKINGTTGLLQDLHFRASRFFILGQTGNQVLLFGGIAWILFGMPQLEAMSATAIAGYLVSFIYLMTPLNSLLNLIPFFGRAEVALQKIEELGVTLDGLRPERLTSTTHSQSREWKTLQLCGVTHAYHRERDDDSFVLGPVDMAFHPGELVFLIGGNGSGKSTLAKILVGLYPPEAGCIRLDEEIIDEGKRDEYRQIFSAVFSDFHLFDDLLGLAGDDADGRAREYLRELHLDHKVSVSNGALSTTALSQGQRKRLALLTAFLEDRSFYVFDEWASDQDPAFKKVFYLRLLPELRSRGKTVLVITHDERYVGVADRLFRMEDGQLRLEREGRTADTAEQLLSPQDAITI